MPELPEVETVCRGLAALLPGRRISGVECLNAKSFPQADSACLIGAGFLAVRRRAKLIIIELDNGHCLLAHLKMTGQLVFVADDGERFGAGHPNDSLVDRLPDRSTRVIFRLTGATLYFNDQRKFGWILLLDTDRLAEQPFLRKLGPEPLSDTFSAEVLAQALRRRSRTSVKAALLDQTVLAGVGNIYADEALWAAEVHPSRPVGSLSPDDIERLWRELRVILQLSIDQGGSSDRNYVDATGQRGSYLRFARVFRRQGQLCPRCGSTIIKTRVAGRGTHLCPTCQLAPVGTTNATAR